MNKKNSLEEDEKHGTKLCPVHYMYFLAGSKESYPDGFFVKRHWHPSCEILHIIKGTFEVELDFVSLTLKEGDFCFVNSGQLHELRGLEKETEHEVIIFQPAILDFSYGDALEEQVISPFLKKELAFPYTMEETQQGYIKFKQAYDRITDVCKTEKEGWYFETKWQLLWIMQFLAREGLYRKAAHFENESEKVKVDRYKMLVSYMQEHYDQPVTLKDLQKAAGCNEKYLCQFFKHIAGVSPIQYLIQYRVSQAEYMLRNTTKSVLEISMDCGFDNVSYFIRQFKRSYQMTPLQYRKNIEKE